MKSKRFLCTVLACVVMISCITNAAAIQEEVADDFWLDVSSGYGTFYEYLCLCNERSEY